MVPAMSDDSKKQEKPAPKMPDNYKVLEMAIFIAKAEENFGPTDAVDFKLQDVRIQCSFSWEGEELSLTVLNKVEHFLNRPLV